MLKEALYFQQLKKYERRLNIHHIRIVHFIPGRIRLKSELWKQNEPLLQKVEAVIKKEPFVKKISFEVFTGSLVIEFQLKEPPPLEIVKLWVERIIKLHRIKD
ncbi:HMA2 domain-containing protein [Niallia endozanthoxylica]|uniref:Uncharacterized protein n=1 Tax=Niallia endozanthoxylica TaxID=2036016 RepID=A0A5J5I524_9BACI|nr:hypothetical protein [Niallia endozanthoxylica]KAA9030615.1 hypothetical protein F4V44_02130 [Niallia endozanthoxylica]